MREDSIGTRIGGSTGSWVAILCLLVSLQVWRYSLESDIDDIVEWRVRLRCLQADAPERTCSMCDRPPRWVDQVSDRAGTSCKKGKGIGDIAS